MMKNDVDIGLTLGKFLNIYKYFKHIFKYIPYIKYQELSAEHNGLN